MRFALEETSKGEEMKTEQLKIENLVGFFLIYPFPDFVYVYKDMYINEDFSFFLLFFALFLLRVKMGLASN